MERFIQTGVIAVLAAGLFGCATPVPVKTHTVYSDDGVSEIVVTDSWYTRPDLGRNASVRVADADRDVYLLVITYFPHEIDPMSIEDFAARISGLYRDGMGDGKLSEPRRLVINDRPALEYQITGTSDGTPLVYLSTAVEGRLAKYSLIAWTSAARFPGNRDLMRAAIASFRESATRRTAVPRTNLVFNWPARLTSTASFHSKRDKRGDRTELRAEVVSSVRPSGDGLRVVSSRVTSQKMTTGSADGKKADFLQQLLREAMTDMPDYVIDDDGGFVRIDNLGAYQQRIEAAILKGLKDAPEAGRAKARQLMQALLSEPSLAAMAQDEWNNVVGNWAGSSYVPGRSYEFVLSYQSPALGEQLFPMTVTRQLKGHTPCRAGAAAKSCVRLVQTSRVSGPEFTRATGRLVSKTVGVGVKVESVELIKTVELVSEPATLLPHAVQVREVNTVVVSADGKSQTSTETKESTTTYRYPP